jgi:hypothetical protein
MAQEVNYLDNAADADVEIIGNAVPPLETPGGATMHDKTTHNNQYLDERGANKTYRRIRTAALAMLFVTMVRYNVVAVTTIAVAHITFWLLRSSGKNSREVFLVAL